MTETEIEIRTPNEGLLVCKAIKESDGKIKLLSRHGKKTDTMTVDDFMKQVYRI